MIITGPEIVAVRERTAAMLRVCDEHGWRRSDWTPQLDVSPWRPECVGPNSLDVHLGTELLTYDLRGRHWIDPLDPPAAAPVRMSFAEPGDDRWFLEPGVLYLGATQERVELHGLVAWVDGRSSLGRLGVQCHMTAGLIDDGFSGAITLEITVVHPTILRPGMRLAQVTFMRVEGVRKPYTGRYANATGPEASKYHLPSGAGGC